MAQPTTFMLQHNNISQVNDIYYTNNITKKYLGYKYKLIHMLKKVLKFSFIRKHKIKIKILMLKSTQKKMFKLLKKKIKQKVSKLKYFMGYDRFLRNYNKGFVFSKLITIKKLNKPERKKRKFFRVRWLLKKKTLKKIFKKNKKIFSIMLVRLVRVKSITFLNYVLKKIKYKKYDKYAKWGIKRVKKNIFISSRLLKKFPTRVNILKLNNQYT